jgi:hypothetical protein
MQMVNDNQDTARFQLDRFLNGDHSFDYDLDAYDIALLYAITYYIDLQKKGKNACLAKQSTLATRARLDRKVANRRIKKLAQYNLIVINRRWKLLWITLGDNLIMSLPGTALSTREGHDQGADRYTTIEDKKQRIRETTQEESFLFEDENTKAVDQFISGLFGETQ